MDRCKKNVGAIARLREEEIQRARWFGWSSSSWSRELGTLRALMNYREGARKGGGENNNDRDRRRRRRRRRE